MNNAIEPKRLRDLLSLLSGMQSLHQELLALIRTKIGAMKRNDLAAVQELCEQERALAARIHEREGLRQQLMDVIARLMGWPPHAARVLSLSQEASRVSGPQRAALMEARDALRSAVAQVAKANHVAGEVARGVLGHLKWVFASVKPRRNEPVGYSDAGVSPGRSETLIFDTVG